MVYYKPSISSPDKFDFAFAMPFANGTSGNIFVPFNTYQPSLDVVDAGKGVANWIQLTSLSSKEQKGKLIFYNIDGTVLGVQDVTLDPEARLDVSGHQFGPSLVGNIEWRPESKKAKFRMRNVRYFYDAPGFTSDKFVTAFQLEAVAGTGAEVVAPLDTNGASSILELSNTTNKVNSTAVTIYDAKGSKVISMILDLLPNSSHHLITDQILNGQQGLAVIKGSLKEGLIATVMQYGRTPANGMVYLYGIRATEAVGQNLRGSYNTFLDQKCKLLLSNASEEPQKASVSMTRSDGTVVMGERSSVRSASITVPGHGMVDYNLCSNDNPNNYGVVTVTAENNNALTGTVVRIGKDDQYRFPTPMRR